MSNRCDDGDYWKLRMGLVKFWGSLIILIIFGLWMVLIWIRDERRVVICWLFGLGIECDDVIGGVSEVLCLDG